MSEPQETKTEGATPIFESESSEKIAGERSKVGGRSLERRAKHVPTFGTEKGIKTLSVKQRAFVVEMLKPLATVAQAARNLGITPQTAGAMYKKPHVQAVLRAELAKTEQRVLMTKRKVLDGFLEAVAVGKLKADSIAMTAAWREIAKMCGYYAPVEKKVRISMQGGITIHKIQQLTEEELLQLAYDDVEKGDIIDGEARVLEDSEGAGET